jgi:hypothetical protein
VGGGGAFQQRRALRQHGFDRGTRVNPVVAHSSRTQAAPPRKESSVVSMLQLLRFEAKPSNA